MIDENPAEVIRLFEQWYPAEHIFETLECIPFYLEALRVTENERHSEVCQAFLEYQPSADQGEAARLKCLLCKLDILLVRGDAPGAWEMFRGLPPSNPAWDIYLNHYLSLMYLAGNATDSTVSEAIARAMAQPDRGEEGERVSQSNLLDTCGDLAASLSDPVLARACYERSLSLGQGAHDDPEATPRKLAALGPADASSNPAD
jgi:hypothetical protein